MFGSTTVEIVAVCLTPVAMPRATASTTVEIVAVCLTQELIVLDERSTTVEIVAVCLTPTKSAGLYVIYDSRNCGGVSDPRQ